jgi:hypothetical protein
VIIETDGDAIRYVIGLAERPKHLTEPERARLHAATRKVRMTDKDLVSLLEAAMPTHHPADTLLVSVAEVSRFVRDLRDRYEEIGKYAPAAPQPEKPELEPK